MRLRDHDFQISYGPADDRLHDFYIPALSCSIRYDRTAGFFASSALAVAAAGVARLIAQGGSMRLLAGAQLSEADVRAIERGQALDDVVAGRLVAALSEPEEEVMRRRLEVLAWLVAAAVILASPGGPFRGGAESAGIEWEEFSDGKVTEAKSAGMPVMIDFSADWCIPCHELEEKCFPDERVVETAAKFVTLKVDMTRIGEKQKKLKKRFDIRGVPTIIFIGTDGEEIKDIRVTGYVESDELLRRMKKAAGKSEDR